MNCHPTYCGMEVTVDGGRLISVAGDETNPDSRGFVCPRGRATAEIPHNPHRLLRSLRREQRGAGVWIPTDWDAALDQIAAAMQSAGRERVAIWLGHGAITNDANRQLIMRFGHLYGCQAWNPAVLCWAQGAFGLSLTGVLEVNTKEDLGAHAEMLLLWGWNVASQPTSGPYVTAAKKRGARVVCIDVRRSEAARLADEAYIIRPGTDAALALAMAHVIVQEGLTDAGFIARHTLGYAEFARHLAPYSPAWAAQITGMPAEAIARLARLYATRKPGAICMGGSSMFKSKHGWLASRAIACLPALTGNLGIAGGGFGPRHRGFIRGEAYADFSAGGRRPPGNYISSHMGEIVAAIESGRIDVLLLFGTNMLSGYADSGRLERALANVKLIVAHDLFESETIRRAADIVLPGTSWLEEIGVKHSATHVYLMERALAPQGEARSNVAVLRALADRLGVADYYPWPDQEAFIDALLAPLDGGRVTLDRLRREEGRYELKVSGMPLIAAGVRMAAILALVAVVAGEMIAALGGIGSRISWATETFEPGYLYGYILLVVIIIAMANMGSNWLERLMRRS